MARKPSRGRDDAPVQMQFDDNRLLAQLFGEHDRNLAVLEDRLGVSVASRGNRLAISGPVDAAAIARTALAALYRDLGHGSEVGPAEVEAAITRAGGGGGTVLTTRKRAIAPRNAAQDAYIRALRECELVFGVGPAGTGKTYLAVACAVQSLLAGEVEHIILSRPAVEAGERLGFLPGDIREKVDPYLRPLFDALYDMLPGDQVMKRMTSGEIEIAPLAFMRGRTLARSFVILDEAQNATPMQMKMFLTRLGEGSRMAVTGDVTQIDLPTGTRSGLIDAIETLEGTPGIRFVRFSAEDTVRHPLVNRIVNAYERAERARRGQIDPGAVPSSGGAARNRARLRGPGSGDA
jgi:phosphate starvation-inducible protein PhoH and related proteins